MKEPKVAIYIRLSMADEDSRYGKAESGSIQHQRMFIHDYLDRHEELRTASRAEFVDDGYTGTNTDRPGFQAVMKALRSGERNVLITKDFSRAMRDYTEMGNYLECVFPFLGVRYISINDGYDSNNYKGVTGSMDVVLRNIVYASYSKDLSVKTTTAKLQMMKQGKYVGSFAPYGYQFHPEIRNKLILDEEAAKVVRRVFDLILSGMKASQVARVLNVDGVLTPGSYFRLKHPGSKRFAKKDENNGWNNHTVLAILKQYEYTGATVGHKRSKAGISTKKTLPNAQSDWLIVEGMHDAIVSHEEFQKVQEMIKNTVNTAGRKQHTYPLKGIVRCSKCKRVMTRREKEESGKIYYTCNKSTSDPRTTCPVGKHFLESNLERVVLNAIQQMLILCQKAENSQQGQILTRQGRRKACIAEMAGLAKLQEQYRQEKLQIYEDYVAGRISKESYLEQKAKMDGKLSEVKEKQKGQEKKLAELEAHIETSENPLQALNSIYSGADKLTREMVQAFVQDIYVYPDAQVEIVWKFKDCFGESLKKESAEGE